MKYIRSFQINKTTINSAANTVSFNVQGDPGAVFSLQIKDNSTPNKFFNFKTKAFTNTFTSENTFSNIKLASRTYTNFITIPAVTNATDYKFFLFADSHFNTEMLNSENKYLLTQELSQSGGVTVRMSTASDQGDTNFEVLGLFTSSLTGFDDPVFTGSTLTSANTTKNIAFVFADGADGVAEGYKATFNTVTKLNEIADSLQPIESDFFIKFTKTASGNGSSATELVLTNIDNLVVGMSLVQIASTPVRISGSLGNFVFPTITAIDTTTKTITLSNAQSWSDTNNIIFRAYGNDLIRESVGLTFTQNLKVQPTDSIGTDGKLSTLLVTAATNTSVTVSSILGVSAGSRIFGPGIDSTAVTGGFNNDVTAVNFGTGVLTMRGNQNVIADNTVVFVGGSSNYIGIKGSVTITRFPSIDTDIFFDVDRAVILSTAT
tara:strand:+ start:5073 stop:6374 length:1302 start_codon:yes stop_codon:yes gene_type:complete